MKRSITAALILCLIAVAVYSAEGRPDSPAAAPRNDAWKIIGPGGGGAQFYPTISPVDPNVVMVRCDMTGSYITKDGGKSWRMCCFRGTSSGFIFDPVDPNIIYVRARGTFRSADGGNTWELVFPNPDKIEGITFNGDHAGESWRLAEGAVSPGALAIDPADSKTLYGVFSDREGSTLQKSSDWGKTWSTLAELPGGRASQTIVDPRSPKDNRTIYLLGSGVDVFENGAMRHNDGPQGVQLGTMVGGFPKGGGRLIVYGYAGGRRRGGFSGFPGAVGQRPGAPTAPGGAPGQEGATRPGAAAGEAAPAERRTGAPEGAAAAAASAAQRGEIYVSRDGGETWESATGDLYANLAEGADRPSFSTMATCLYDADVVYISYRDYRAADSPDPYLGVVKTADGGKTWKLVWKDTAETPGESSKDAWMNERFGPDWGENPISLGVAPTDANICFGTDYGRTLFTKDGGKTWQAAYSKQMDDGSWTTTGLDVTTNYGVHFDPFDRNRLIISYTDIGAFASDNGGVSWRSATVGVPGGWVNTTYWVVFDPDVKGRAWGVTGSAHDLPRPKMWRRGSVAGYRGGVILSDDSGRTWRRWDEKYPETSMTHIIMDPKSPKEARVLYATGFGTGVWKSSDGGKTWTLKNNGLPEREPFAWWLTLDKNGLLYLIIARRSDDGSYGNEEDGALYRSADGAETWERLALPEGLNGPNGLAIDPEDPKRLYLAVWGRGPGETGGIWISTDAGKTWEWVFDQDRFVYDVTIDPRDSNVLYACGFSSSAWRSEDKGLTWTRIKGFNFKWGHRAIPDPYDANMIFVTTFGGSVWYGPAKGDPNAPEDIVTPVVTPGNLWGRAE